MEILFVSGVSPIARDPAAGQRFYRDTLGLPLLTNAQNSDYVAMDGFGGVKHFGVWALADAAQSCFGVREWPVTVPIPQATIELEVRSPEAVGDAARELEARGYALIHGQRIEPWGQVLARLLGPEGLLIGLSFTPWMHPPA
ncbi:MAG: glyoxalase [Deltaproteobacteria bacterium]|nr:glyoxalase [Deltaproteobacteria bacterium]